MAEGSNGRRRFSDKWGKHELDVLAVLSSAFPQWLTSRQIAQRVKAYADSYGELADQAAKAAFAKQFQRDRAKLAAMGIAIESRQPEYSSKSEGQDFASYRLQLGDEPRIRLRFQQADLPVLAAANYLARSMSMSSAPVHTQQHASRTAPRVPQTPIPGLGLDSMAPGLGTQHIPENLVREVDSRRFAATVAVGEEHLNVAYTDADDLAMFVLEHPNSSVVSPPEAVAAFRRRLNAATQFQLADDSANSSAAKVRAQSIESADGEGDEEETDGKHGKKSSFQTGSEVDRRLRLMLFLSAHLGEEYSLPELATRFIGEPKSDDELKKYVATIHKDINTLTTVSDDGEMAGSQFFDIDWSLLDAEGIVSATNSLGLERLAGISPQYMSMLTASVNYLAHASLLPADQREQAQDLYERLVKHVAPGETPWLSLTGYEVEPRSFTAVKNAIKEHKLLNMVYRDGAGRNLRRLVAPSRCGSAGPAGTRAQRHDDQQGDRRAAHLAGAHNLTHRRGADRRADRRVACARRLGQRFAQMDHRHCHASGVHHRPTSPAVHQDACGRACRTMRRRREGPSVRPFRFVVRRVLHRARAPYCSGGARNAAVDDGGTRTT